LIRDAYEEGVILRSWDDLYVLAIRKGDRALIDRVEWLSSMKFDMTREFLLKEIEKWWKNRLIEVELKTLEEMVLRGESDVNDLVGRLGSIYSRVSGNILNGSDRVNVLDGVLERIVEREEVRERKILYSGIFQLDAILNGFRSGTLTVWIGATSVGKTMMLIYQSVIFMLQDKKVLFISLEDNKEMLLEKFDRVLFSNVAEFPGKIEQRAEFLRLIDGKVEVSYFPRLSIEELEARMRGTDAEVLVVDYGDLLHIKSGFRGEDWLEQGEIFERLMRIADRYDMWVVTASQANREALSKKVLTIGNVSRSFRKVQVADYVFALSQSKDEEQEGRLRIVVLKNKFGKRGDVVTVRVNREVGWFRDEFVSIEW
jgi:replicative DNA helicase